MWIPFAQRREMMYAVIKNGGKQYRVAIGDVIRVERLPVTPGESVTLEQVMLVKDDNDLRVGAPVLDETVTATVRSHGRGNKIEILKLRRRKNSRRRAGHRQGYTELEVTGIAGVTKKPAKSKPRKKVARTSNEAMQTTAES